MVELRLAERDTSAPLPRQCSPAALPACGSRCSHDDFVLVVSELVTNALLHGHGTPTVRLNDLGDRIRVEGCDESPLLPVSHRVTPATGLGLRVVEQISSAWGASRRGRGKVVWCEV